MGYLLQIINQTLQAPEDKNNFWNISYDAWFTGLTPILIFILGYIINKRIENNKEKRRLKELEGYFKRLLGLIKKPLNKQKEAFLKFSHSLKEKKGQHLILDEVTNFHVEQIKEISNKDLYTIFIKNKKGSIAEKTELYGKLRASIDYIDNIKKTTKNYFLMFWEKYDKNQQDYNRNIEITDEAFYSMISQSQSASLQQDWLLSGIDKIRLNWLSFKKENVDNRDMYIATEMYINPVRDLCKQNIRDPRSAFILKHIMLCIYAFNNIEEAKKVFRRHFLLDAKGLQKSWFDINGVLKKFDSM